MQQVNDSKTHNILKKIIQIVIALIIFGIVKFLFSELWAIALTNILYINSDEMKYFMFTVGNLFITIFFAFPIFCLCMHFSLKNIVNLFKSSGHEKIPVHKYILLGLAAVSPMVLIECGMLIWGGLDIEALTPGSGILLLAQVMQSIIVMPIIEEMMFRGVVLDSLNKYKKSVAIVISTLAFSIGHLDIINLLISLPLGILLGFAALKTCSIRVPVILHMLVNLYAMILVPWLLTSQSAILVIVISLIFITGGCIIIKKSDRYSLSSIKKNI